MKSLQVALLCLFASAAVLTGCTEGVPAPDSELEETRALADTDVTIDDVGEHSYARKSQCGNGKCKGNESCTSCPADCGTCPWEPVCGDGTCEGGESCENCAADCGECPSSECGNEVCESGENCSNCSSDCGECPDPCNDGLCTDTDFFCPDDGDCNCGNAVCDGWGEWCFCQEDCPGRYCP